MFCTITNSLWVIEMTHIGSVTEMYPVWDFVVVTAEWTTVDLYERTVENDWYYHWDITNCTVTKITHEWEDFWENQKNLLQYGIR